MEPFDILDNIIKQKGLYPWLWAMLITRFVLPSSSNQGSNALEVQRFRASNPKLGGCCAKLGLRSAGDAAREDVEFGLSTFCWMAQS